MNHRLHGRVICGSGRLNLNQSIMPMLGAGTLGLDFALMDPAAPGSPSISGERQPDPAESSRQPGYESRVSYSFPLLDRSFTVGAGGYYSRQTYLNKQHVDAWAGTADWKVPFSRWLELSGEFYRGRALGGLGGGTFKDYVTDPDSGLIHGLGDEGGWSQLKAASHDLLRQMPALAKMLVSPRCCVITPILI